MNVNLNAELTAFIEAKAVAEGLTPEACLERYVLKMLAAMWREQLAGRIKVAPIEDLPQFDTAVKTAEAENLAAAAIKAAEVQPAP